MSVSVRKGEHGTVLIVVVATLALVGAVLLLGIGSFHTTDNPDLVRRTTQRQDFVIRELAAYVQRTNTLPCPADPSIAETSANFGVARAVPCLGANAEGILPFRTLNLSEYDARDGWSRFMTYHVSPVLTDTSVTLGKTIFMRCRRLPWFQHTSVTQNEYPAKALFCCPAIDAPTGPATDIVVSTAAGGAAIDGISRGKATAAAFYGDINAPVTPDASAPIPPAAGLEDMFAFALVSYGANGIGAYLANGTPARLGVPGAVVGADETENLNGDNKFVDRAISITPGANYFDDIVVWRTQITLMGALNNASCYIPWR